MTLSNAARALLAYIAEQKRGRVSYALLERDRVMNLAGELLEAKLIRDRRLGFEEGFQLTPEGRAFLAGGVE